jgi:hypothetical protein
LPLPAVAPLPASPATFIVPAAPALPALPASAGKSFPTGALFVLEQAAMMSATGVIASRAKRGESIVIPW